MSFSLSIARWLGVPDAEQARRGWLRTDVVAGFTVAVIGMPQCVAYAMMAGLPPELGLLTAAIPAALAALVGRSPHVITGPTNTTGLLILAAITPYLAGNGILAPQNLPVLALLTVMAGVIRLVLSAAGGAKLVEFVPASVLAGFTMGAGVLIGAMQFDEALGMAAVQGGSLFDELTGLAAAIESGAGPSWPAVGLTVGTVAAIVAGKRFAPKIPVTLLAVVVATVGVFAAGGADATGIPTVMERASMPDGWPPATFPTFEPELIRELFLPALAIALLGTIELVVTARGAGEQPRMGREIAAQGWANLAGGFVGAFPASASLSRSALLRQNRARTRVAALIAAVATGLFLLLVPQVLGHIPLPSLAAVLLVTAARMLNLRRARRIVRGSRRTALLVIATFVATLALPLEWAVMTGVGLALVIHLREGARPRVRTFMLAELAPGAEDAASTVVVEVSGLIHYAAAESLRDDIQDAVDEQDATRIILDVAHAHQPGFSTLQVFEDIARQCEQQGREFVLAGVDDRLARLLEVTRSAIPYVLWEEHGLGYLAASVDEEQSHSHQQ